MGDSRTLDDLKQLQALPLSLKVRLTQQRIRQWVNEYGTEGVYVSFSGGKDSTVLLHLVRELYPNVPAVFVDTGLEYPEIRAFVRTFDNVEWVKPEMNFKQVIKKYGYPMFSKEVCETVYGARKYLTALRNRTNDLTDRQTDRRLDYAWGAADIFGIKRRPSDRNRTGYGVGIGYEELKNGTMSVPIRIQMLNGTYKNKDGESSQFNKTKYRFMLNAPFEISNICCRVMKKHPARYYARKTGRMPFTAQMADESKLRTQKWLDNGCNGFNLKHPTSNPMSFWTEQDVLKYIRDNNIPICSVYGDIVTDDEESGQMTVAQWLGTEDVERPLHCTGVNRSGCMFCGFGCHLEKSPNRFERMKQTHPKQYAYIMKPVDEGGLGFKEVIDWINEHGKMNIKY